YTWGWSLVHFLMNDPRYTAKFQRFFTSLPDSKGAEKISINFGNFYTIREEDVLAAFVRELGLKNADGVRRLEVEWHDYVEGKLHLVSRSGLEKAGFAAKAVDRKIRATRLLKEAIAQGSRNPLAYHSLAEIYAEDGKRSDAMETWKKALEIDPLNGAIYARMAFFLPDGEKAERQRLQALAAELGSDDFWTYLDLESGEKPPAEDPGKKPGGEGPGGKKPPDGG
ncbi:MAG TPA: hypothetical protein VFC77_12105, partial [Myxococcota bacterium]|nr:hypothetical protein [Myxococcota bacterium]